jgi:hypothetical protein
MERPFDRFDFHPSGRAGGLQILRCQKFAVELLRLHPWRLDPEALRLVQDSGTTKRPIETEGGSAKKEGEL